MLYLPFILSFLQNLKIRIDAVLVKINTDIYGQR